jgi:hypothetical protein
MPSTSLNIPNEALSDLKTIAELDEGGFNSLLSAFRESTPTLRHNQFENLIASKIKSISRGDLQSVLRTAFYLYRQRERLKMSPQQISEAVINSSGVSQSVEFPAEKKDKLKKRIGDLLNLDKTLGVTAKALDVMTEHDKTFCEARILSDIRPVFSEKPEEASAAVIIHNLQIRFHQFGKHQEAYFALDTDDIQALKEIIERAEKKTIALKSMIAKSAVPYLEV